MDESITSVKNIKSRCLHPDTQVLMYLGGMKSAKEVKRGDILLGDDSQPRIVLNTTSGTSRMYKITPEFTDPFIVSETHIITVFNEFTDVINDIPLDEYLKKSDTWRAKHKMFCVPVEYSKTAIKNDPYLVGILLNSKLNTVDDIVKEYLVSRLDNLSSYVNGISDIRTLNLSTIDKIEIAYLLNHRYIPDSYLYNTRENRYKLLKGLIEANKPRQNAQQIDSNGRPRSKSTEHTPTSAGNTGTKSNKPLSLSGKRLSILEKRSSTPNPIKSRTDTIKSRSPGVSRNRAGLNEFAQRALSSSNLDVTNTGNKIRSLTPSTPSTPLTPTTSTTRQTRQIPKVEVRAGFGSKSPAKPTTDKSINLATSKTPAKGKSGNLPLTPMRTKSPVNTQKSKNTITDFKSVDQSNTGSNISNLSDASNLSNASNTTSGRKSRLETFREKLPIIENKDTKLLIKDRILAEQIKFLARSVGYKIMHIADEIWICDVVNDYPMLDRKIETCFHVTPLVQSEHCGFTLDGNGRFILSSFIVTHNSIL